MAMLNNNNSIDVVKEHVLQLTKDNILPLVVPDRGSFFQ